MRRGDGRRLVIAVNEPGQVYAMRLQWLPQVRWLLTDGCGADCPTEVVFEFGQSGVRIPDPAALALEGGDE